MVTVGTVVAVPAGKIKQQTARTRVARQRGFNNQGVAGNIGKEMCLLTSLKLTASL